MEREFVKGEWYTNGRGDYTKFNRMSNDLFLGYEHVYMSVKTEKLGYQNDVFNDTWTFKDSEDITLANMDEIIDYLPNEHPDKIKWLLGKPSITPNYNKLLEILTKYGIN